MAGNQRNSEVIVMDIKLEGFAALEKAMEELSQSQGRAVLRRAQMKAAQPMADLAKSLAPVGPTGRLAKSISVQSRLAKRQAGIHRRTFRDDKLSSEVFVGPTYLSTGGGRHGHLVEFGTVKMAPRPFMRPAWEQDKKNYLDRLGAEMAVQVENAVKRARARAAKG